MAWQEKRVERVAMLEKSMCCYGSEVLNVSVVASLPAATGADRVEEGTKSFVGW